MTMLALKSAAHGGGPTSPLGESKPRSRRLDRFKLEKVCRSCRRKRLGTAAVEFAVVAPAFFLLIFAIVEFGRAFMVQEVMTNAAREGARQRVLEGASDAQAKQTVVDRLVNAGVPNVNTSMVQVATSGNDVTVSIAIPFSQVTWLPTPIYLNGASSTLTAATTMRQETAASGS